MPESDLLQLDGVRVGAGGAALFLTTAAGVVVGLPVVGFTVVLVAVTGACATAVHRPGGLLLGVAGWAFCTGFGVNELGELTFTQADLLRLSAYLGCALLLAGDRCPAQ
ncbi:hypothetical protein D0Z08_16345 [Nocardioides immobilis]|uniref:Uncharacterized protein n=1 Tax=Nocardioides immobilis TaxID=2049295 RepID=A0A417XZY9_9ACTN|nr:hypothetical protein [Nocardioides immobilis]RHW25911.1 hypothetical protein D0Z08_16345 [Nocardioides immobilis]